MARCCDCDEQATHVVRTAAMSPAAALLACECCAAAMVSDATTIEFFSKPLGDAS